MKLLALVGLAACSQPAPAPARPAPPNRSAASVPVDAPAASQEERLAAIQKAMNELDEAAQGCWAAAATERFDIEGGVSVMIEIGEASSKATIVEDRTRNAKLTSCLTQLLEKYRWAPPLYGQSIQLPFNFKAPDGQSVIDRRLVDVHGQGSSNIAVLLDEANTGNDAASMLAVKDDQTWWRKADRTELWYFLAPSTVNGTKVDVGDMLYVPTGGVRNISGTAVLVLVPGGKEGTARAGALPTPRSSVENPSLGKILRAQDAKTFGPATIFLDSVENGKGAPLAASILQLAAGAKVPEHVHEHETEMLYVLEGAGTMTIAGQDIAVTPTSVIQIPPNTKHAFTATAAVRSLQIYTPGGPEQRFKKKP